MSTPLAPPSFSLTDKLILNPAVGLNNPNQSAIHRHFTVRVVGFFTSPTAAVDFLIQVGALLGKGTYITVDSITFHKVLPTKNWTRITLKAHCRYAGHFLKITLIGTIAAITLPSSLNNMRTNNLFRGRNADQGGDHTVKTNIKYYQEASAQKKLDESNPKNVFINMLNSSPEASRNLFLNTLTAGKATYEMKQQFDKFSHGEKGAFVALMNYYDDRQYNEDLGDIVHLRGQWAKTVYIDPNNLTTRHNELRAQSSRSYADEKSIKEIDKERKAAIWRAPHEIETVVRGHLKAQGELSSFLPEVSRAFYFHATKREFVEQIIESGNIEVRAKCYQGAFAATEGPEYGYGNYVFCFRHSIGRISPLYRITKHTGRKIWAGFSNSIPIRSDTLACIIYNGFDKSRATCDRLQQRYSKLAGFEIKVYTPQEAERTLEVVQQINNGVPREWAAVSRTDLGEDLGR